jgi:methylmalonyl-CoA mutase
MSQKNKFDFKEFFLISHQTWKNKILEELDLKNLSDLQWKYKNLSFNKACSPEDLPSAEIGNFQKKFLLKTPRFWYTREYVPVRDFAKANIHALHALNSGSDAIEYHIPAENISRENISSLIKELPLGFSPLHFYINSSLMTFIRELTSLKNENIKGSIAHSSFSLREKKNNHLENLNIISDAINLTDHLSRLRWISIGTRGLHINNVSPEKEIAFAIAAAIDIIDRLSEKGINIQKIYSLLEFSFSTGKSFLPEIAKLRAFRLLWDEVTNSYGKDVHSFSVPLHCSTSPHFYSNDIHYNILHNTTEAMASVIGGCDSLTIYPFDLHQKETNDFSSRISRNISLLMKEEAWLQAVADPGAGSYSLEEMTYKIAEKSFDLLRDIEKSGGLSKYTAA